MTNPLTTPPPEPNTSAEPVGDGGMREVAARAVYAARPAIYIHPGDRAITWEEAQIELPGRIATIYRDVDTILAALTDHATATRLLAEKDARIAEIRTAYLAAETDATQLRKANTEASTRAYGWMVAHDMLKAGKPYDLPSPADVPKAQARALAAEARIAELEAERDAALRECSKWATEAGFAKGKLETSELAGIVDDWRARALAAEARVTELESYAKDVAKECLAERARANKAEAEVEKLREVLEPLVEIAESVTDEGPDGEGWKSHKLLTLISDARQALAPEDR